MGLFDGVDVKKYGLVGEALTTYKLAVAIQALEEIKKKGGPGCDLSPAGDCYDIAKQALDKITS
jgi:hypothetical protein